MSSDTLKVARWEFLQNVRSKMFLILTIAIPILIVVVGFIPNFLAGWGEGKHLTLYLVDRAGIYSELDQALSGVEGKNFSLKKASSSVEQLKEEATEQEIDGYFVLEEPLRQYQSTPIKIFSNLDDNEGLLNAGETLGDVMGHLVASQALSDEGYDPGEIFSLTREVRFAPVKLETDDRELGEIFLPFGVAIMIVMSSMFSGSMVMTGIVQEKKNRIVEIVLSSISPLDMMAGKLIGFALLGMLQIGLWGVVGAVSLTQIAGIPLGGVTPFQVLYYFLYFVLGYLMIASLYALLGASSRDMQSSGQSRGIFVILPLFPIYFSGAILSNPDALWVKLVSYIPIFTPTMMLMRSGYGGVPTWEVLVSLLVLLVFVYFTLRLATKVFRVGMLMYGKDMSIGEILHWAKS
ncbi:MAG: ABC transporter permease [Candidatus Acetothermia bacterium]